MRAAHLRFRWRCVCCHRFSLSFSNLLEQDDRIALSKSRKFAEIDSEIDSDGALDDGQEE